MAVLESITSRSDRAAATGASAEPRGVVLIAASAGAADALCAIFSELPRTFPLPIVVVQYRTATPPHLLARVLGRRSPLKMILVRGGENLRKGMVYLAPWKKGLMVTDGRSLVLADGRQTRSALSSSDSLFTSAAGVFKHGTIALVLTGDEPGASDGLESVKRVGGIVFENRDTSECVNLLSAAGSRGGNSVIPFDRLAAELMRLASDIDRPGPPSQGFGRIRLRHNQVCR